MYTKAPQIEYSKDNNKRLIKVFMNMFKEQYPLTKEDLSILKDNLANLTTYDYSCVSVLAELNIHFKDKYSILNAIDKKAYDYILISDFDEFLVVDESMTMKEYVDNMNKASSTVKFIPSEKEGFYRMDFTDYDEVKKLLIEMVEKLNLESAPIKVYHDYFVKDKKENIINIFSYGNLPIKIPTTVEKEFKKVSKYMDEETLKVYDAYVFEKYHRIAEYYILEHLLQDRFGISLLKVYAKETRRTYVNWYSANALKSNKQMKEFENSLKKLLFTMDKKEIKKIKDFYLINNRGWWD